MSKFKNFGNKKLKSEKVLKQTSRPVIVIKTSSPLKKGDILWWRVDKIMNNKGQTVGTMLTAAIGIIVALVIFAGAIVPQIGASTSTYDVVNNSITVSDTAFVSLSGIGYSNVVMVNTTGTFIEAPNYTIENRVLDENTGELTARINATQADAILGNNWNITGTVEPTGYIGDSGGRAIAELIAVFAALAIAVFALFPTLRSGVMDMMSR